MEDISLPTEPKGKLSSTVMQREVFLTELTIVSRSIGLIVLRSITSAEMPIFSSSSAASNAYFRTREKPIIVISEPSLKIFAFPISTK